MRPKFDPADLLQQRYAVNAQVEAFAPGRVNLIGEHTDYNDGFVLPMAIQYGVRVAAMLADDGRVEACSANFSDQPASFALGDQVQGTTWGDYLRALLLELDAAEVRVGGLRAAFVGDVPDGAGLSSSAAFAVAATLAVSKLAGKQWSDVVDLARVGQAAEHRLGVKCGLLDQMASAACSAGSAMLMDCRDFSRRMIPLNRSELAVIVGATGVHRTLAGSKYNERRAECEQGAATCGARSLRDVEPETLEDKKSLMTDEVYRRCRHILSENRRVHQFAAALGEKDYKRLGELMLAGHASLRDDYEVSCDELDAMVAAFTSCSGVYGARMVGGGFGGSAIALAEPAQADAVIAAAQTEYQRRTNLDGAFYTVVPGDGAVARLS